MRRNSLPAIRVLFSAIALGAVFHFYDLSMVVHRALSVPSSSLASAILLFAAGTVIFVLKWQLALPSGVGFVATARGYVASFFYSLMPAGQVGGELGKVMALANRVTVRALAASVIFDKLTGLLALTLLGILASVAAAGPLTSLMLVLLSGVAIVTVGALALTKPADVFLARFTPKSPTLSHLCAAVRSLAQSLSYLVRVRHLVGKSLALGALGQASVLAIYVMLAAPLDIRVAFPDLALVVVVANLAAVVPISLAGVGVREASLVGLLALYDVPGESAIALSLTVFALFLLGAAAGALIEARALINISFTRRARQLRDPDSESSGERKTGE